MTHHSTFFLAPVFSLACLIAAACDNPHATQTPASVVAAPTPPPQPVISAASSSSAPQGRGPAAAIEAAGSHFDIVFQLYDGALNAKTEYRAKLRVKTSDGQTFAYKTPVGHAECYLLTGDTSSPSMASIDGDAAHLICSGGGATDEATVVRKTETLVEVVVFQKAYSGPGTPGSKPEHGQTFSITVPKGATLRTTFESVKK